MQWTPRDAGIFELIDDERGGPPLVRIGFVGEDRAACELAPSGRFVFSYVSDPKSVHIVDQDTGRVAGVIPLSWKDSGTLDLGGEKIEWKYAGVFSKAREWVDANGTMLVHLDANAVKLGGPSNSTLLLVALGWFLRLRCDATPPADFVAPGSALAWALPPPKLAWTESEHPDAQFELRLGEDGEPLAQLTILNATTGAGAVKRFGGAIDEGKWILELVTPRLTVRNADTKEVVATMDVDGAFGGTLSFAGARYAWSCKDDVWSFTGEDGKPILGYDELSVDAFELELALHGDHPHASFLAFVSFFVLAMKHMSEGMPLLCVSLSPDETDGARTSTSGSGLTAGDAIDIAGSIFDLLD